MNQVNSMGNNYILSDNMKILMLSGTSLLSISTLSSPAVVCIQLSVDYLFLGESRLCCCHLPILELALNPAYALCPKRESVCNMKSRIEQLFQSSYRDYGLGQNPVVCILISVGMFCFSKPGVFYWCCYTSMIRLSISLHACTTM